MLFWGVYFFWIFVENFHLKKGLPAAGSKNRSPKRVIFGSEQELTQNMPILRERRRQILSACDYGNHVEALNSERFRSIFRRFPKTDALNFSAHHRIFCAAFFPLLVSHPFIRGECSWFWALPHPSAWMLKLVIPCYTASSFPLRHIRPHSTPPRVPGSL